jgi:hypothetical protein
MVMEELRPWGEDDETLRRWPPRDDDREYEVSSQEEEVPFHVPRD